MKMNEYERKAFEDYIEKGKFYIYYQRSSQTGMTRFYKVFLLYENQLLDITFLINQKFYNSDKREIKVHGFGFSGEDYIARKIENDFGSSIEWHIL